MSENNERIKLSSGLYDAESVYKYIDAGDIDITTHLINQQLSQIINSKYRLSDRENYCVGSHNVDFDAKSYNVCKAKKDFRMEEWICKQCKDKNFTAVGKIMDYQIPLKRKRTEEYAGMGKIDLLAQKDEMAYILEVKSPKSTEEPLKAILEIYTYWRQLGGENCRYFLDNSCLKNADKLEMGVVFFENSSLHKKYLADEQRLNSIMTDLNVKLFLAQPIDEVDYFIKDIIDGKNYKSLDPALKSQEKSSYAEKVKERIVHTVPELYLNGTYKGRRYKHLCKEQKYNFIDYQFPEYCALKGNLSRDKINYHIGIKNLNSSQAMCINFFKKFFETDADEHLLLDILRDLNIDIPHELSITSAQFEYVPNPYENTNFDFFMVLSDGRHISFEIKYTENNFGKIGKPAVSQDKYIIKWHKYYRPLLEKCPYFKKQTDCQYQYSCMMNGELDNQCKHNNDCIFFQFFTHYQICRNIAYAENKNDIVIFLTPKENDALENERMFIESFAEEASTKNILNIYWETLINRSILRANSNDLRQYLERFRDKYFPQYYSSQNRCVLFGGLEKRKQSLETDFVVVELSASGDNMESDEIVKLSAVKINNMTIQDSLELYIKPQKQLTTERKELLNISDDILEHGHSLANALQIFEKWNESKIIVQYHNEYNIYFLEHAKFQCFLDDCLFIDAQALTKNMFSAIFEDQLCSFSSAYQLLFGNEEEANAENEAKLFIELLSCLKSEYDFRILEDIETYWKCR